MTIHLIEDNLLLPTTENILKRVKNAKIYSTIELQAVPSKDNLIILSDSTFFVRNVLYLEDGSIYLLGVIIINN